MKNEQIKRVAFIEVKLKDSFEKLKSGKIDQQQLVKNLDLALDILEKNEQAGIKIPSKQWPKEYLKKYKITNLWKFNLDNGWQIIYTIKGNNIEIISIIIEWITHKDYERKFSYKRS